MEQRKRDSEASRLLDNGSDSQRDSLSGRRPSISDRRTPQDEVRSPKLLLLILLSIVISCSNQVIYKKLLNRFSAPTHNYEFFVSQWTTLLYIIPSLVVVLYKVVFLMTGKDRSNHQKEVRSSQTIYGVMGTLDAASSTLGAIGGAMTPGQLQTLLNQTIIPITIVLSILYIGERFKANQIWGATLIMIGSILASVPFLSDSLAANVGGGEEEGGGASSSLPSSSATATSIAIFASSILPAAMSNVYKETKMKGKNLEVYTTTTFISIWQEVLGFAFLPLLTLKAFGGLGKDEVWKQMEYGYECFNERNPMEGDNCKGAFYLFWAYVLVNWLLNVLLLMLTKEGSAVMLVVANALALPITNVAFSVKGIMGPEVEPFSLFDLLGLIFVIGGFLVYSSFGLAKKFSLAAGPPGQMAYVPVDNKEGTFVLTAFHALDPRRLASFLVALHGGSVVEGSVTGALELARRTVKVLESYREKPGSMPLDSYPTPKMKNGGIRGIGRISPTMYESYGGVENEYEGTPLALSRSESLNNL